MSINTVRNALQDTIEANVSGWAVYPYFVLNPMTPAILIIRGGGPSSNAYTRRSTQYPFRLLAIVSIDDAESGQRQLEALAERGSNSLLDALETDRTLGGAVQTIQVDNVGADEAVGLGDGLFLGAYYDVTVTPSIT